jgi:cation:H+ antiporter
VAVGNIMGAGIYNLLAIMGLVATVSPIPVPSQILAFDLWFMLATTAVLLFFLLMRGGLNRVVAVSFLLAFVGYTALQYYGVDKVMARTPAPPIETARTK